MARNVVQLKPEFFGPEGEEQVPARLMRRIGRTITIGGIVALVFVVGLGLWAAFSNVAGAVSAPGVVRVENNRKTVKKLEPGIIRRILVHEGDEVRQGQLLIEFDDSQPRSQYVELQSAYDSALADRARYEAEATGKAAITYPAELLARRSDPSIAAEIASQEALFQGRRAALLSQIEIGSQRVQELNSQIAGMRAQVASTDAQLSLNNDELGGVQSLYGSGYAPRTRLLALQRSAASLAGSRGAQVSEIARIQQAIGETRLQMLSARQARTAEAAAGIATAQDKLTAIGARLAAAKDSLSHTQIAAPVSGRVLNLSQFTVGGVTGAGEPLLDIVPTGAPLVIQAQVEPKDVHAVKPGQRAQVTLTAFNTRTTPRIEAQVITVGADQTVDPHTGRPYFTVELKIPADQLKRLPKTVQIYPGMPAQVSIVNGEKTILSYLVGPLLDVFRQSMHEQ